MEQGSNYRQMGEKLSRTFGFETEDMERMIQLFEQVRFSDIPVAEEQRKWCFAQMRRMSEQIIEKTEAPKRWFCSVFYRF